jgi:hypothetical protein
MKKANGILYIVIAIVTVFSCLIVGGCDYSLKKARALTYTEWTDQTAKISFRTVSGGIGNGYIYLSGKKIEAEFVFGIKSSIQVSVLSKDLNAQETDSHYELSTESFSVSDVNQQGQVISNEDDVILFGEHFGRIVLTYSAINPNTVDAWEYYEDWAESSGKLILAATRDGYFSNKCRRAVAVTLVGEKELIFQWLPESGKFLIFSYVDEGLILDNIVAEGMYSNVAEEATLIFTMDKLFDGTVSSLTLRIVRK